MDFETILYERKGRTVYITLNRPQKLNAVNDQMAEEMSAALRMFDSDDEAWIAILSGAGRCFSSGADVQQRQLRGAEELKRIGGPAGVKVFGGGFGSGDTVNWKPIIAAVHGYAIGAGISFAQDCDLIVAADNAKFQIREVERGVGGAPHWVDAWFWGGHRIANELALTGRFMDAEEAYRLGIVNRVVSQENMMAEAEALAEEVLKNPPLSVRCNVRAMRWYVREMRREAEMYQQGLKLHLTEDFRESAHAFLEKRKPVFKGR